MGNCSSTPPAAPVKRKLSAKRLSVPGAESKRAKRTGSERSMRRWESCDSKSGQLRSIVSLRRRQAEEERKDVTPTPSCSERNDATTECDAQSRQGELKRVGSADPWAYTLKRAPPNPWETTTTAYERYLSQYSLACDQPTADAFEKWKEENAADEDNMVPASTCSDSDEEELCCSVRFQAPEHTKSGYEHRTILRCLKTSPLFRKLRDNEFDVFAKAAQRIVFRQGDEVFKMGTLPQASRAGLYCLSEGRVDVRTQGFVSEHLTPGACFGEQTVTNQLARSQATMQAMSSVTCYFIPADVCLQLLGQQEEVKRGEYLAIMNNIDYLKDLKTTQLIRLCDLLEEVTYLKGDNIIAFNDEAKYFHFILRGEVSVVGREAVSDTIVPSVMKHICDYGVGDPLGHLEMFQHPSVAQVNDPFDTPRQAKTPKNIADVVAKTDEVVTARLSREDYVSCMTSATGSLRDIVSNSGSYDYYRGTAGMRFPENKAVVLDHPKYKPGNRL